MSRLLDVLVVAAALTAATQATASLISVDLVAPLSSAEYSVVAVDDQQLSLSITGPSFVVANGDTVRVRWTFADAETFQLRPDPHIGLQASLLLFDPSAPSYSATFGVTWTLFDAMGHSVLNGSEGRQTHAGGDLSSGGLTVALETTVEVGSLVLEMSDLAGIGVGSVEFRGASFLIHNAVFGAPFVLGPGGTIPEPSSLLLLASALGCLVHAARRRSWRHLRKAA